MDRKDRLYSLKLDHDSLTNKEINSVTIIDD
jgi:hypothetical protein